MFELQGRFAMAKVFASTFESEAIQQVINLLNLKIFKDQSIRIMPDGHAGKGCVIGFTSTFSNFVIPNLIGVDIGCGMLVTKIGKVSLNFELLDNFIRTYIPHGFNRNTQTKSQEIPGYFAPKIVSVCDVLGLDAIEQFKGLGSLGGGNHFVEVNEDEEGCLYLVIHTGSRNFGKQVCEYHQRIAAKRYKESHNKNYTQAIESIKQKYQGKEIEQHIKALKSTFEFILQDLEYLEKDDLLLYLQHMQIAQEYASLNRYIIMNRILNHLLTEQNISCEQNFESFETIHNYINFKDNIIRKGAISAHKNEKVLIPLNMRDGSIIAIGKGNPDWNYSLPHGAGRIMSRGKAKESISLEEYRESMKEVWTTSVNEHTIDEAPHAYKPSEEILKSITENAEILSVIKPLYNFKSN